VIPRAAVLSLALLLGTAGPGQPPAYTPELNARLFDKAWALVRDKYWNRDLIARTWDERRTDFRARVVAAGDRRQVYTILGEMLASLSDSHVYAIDPVQVEIGDREAEGEAEPGFGLAMLPDGDGVWRVTRVTPASPAARAGVQIGWEVVAVDDAPVDIDFRPRPGERTRFRLRDEHGGEHALTLVAELQDAAPLQRAETLPGGILLIGLGSFERGDDRWIAREIALARPAAMILDLRGNGGGDAEVIARVAGLFFREDRPLVRRITARERIQQAHGAGSAAYAGPLAVLVDGDSASGAEAVAALIQESRRGIVVGERTAGALTGAAYYRLPDGGQLAVAEFDIRTAAGARLEGVGLQPGVPVAPTLAERRAGRDVILDRAVAVLRGRSSSLLSPGSG
jgi:carboxyl-terminal processing protease